MVVRDDFFVQFGELKLVQLFSETIAPSINLINSPTKDVEFGPVALLQDILDELTPLWAESEGVEGVDAQE